MGYSTQSIDLNKALELSEYGEAISASQENHLGIFGYIASELSINDEFESAEISNDKIKDKLVIFFTLRTGDFIEVEC